MPLRPTWPFAQANVTPASGPRASLPVLHASGRLLKSNNDRIDKSAFISETKYRCRRNPRLRHYEFQLVRVDAVKEPSTLPSRLTASPSATSTHIRKSHLLPLIQRPGRIATARGMAAVASRTAARRLRMMPMRPAGVSAVSAGQAEASVSAALSEAVKNP